MSPSDVSPFVRCWSFAPDGIDRWIDADIDWMITQSLCP